MEGQRLDTNATVKISLETSDGATHPSVLVSEKQAMAVEEAAVIGEALEEATPGDRAMLRIQKSSPLTKNEAAEIESVTEILHEGAVPKGSIAASMMSAADKHQSTVKIPINQDAASQLQSITTHALGHVPHGSLAAEVQSLADRAAADKARRDEAYLAPAGPESVGNLDVTAPQTMDVSGLTAATPVMEGAYVGFAPSVAVGDVGSYGVGAGQDVAYMQPATDVAIGSKGGMVQQMQ